MNYLSKGEVLSTVPFRFVGVHNCSTIVAMPISFNFSAELLQFVEVSLGIKAFDLFGIPAFSKRFSEESKMVLGTLELSKDKHHIERVVLFQHVDFHKAGHSTRFETQIEEDCYHKGGLIASAKKIRELYPNIEVKLIYARLINDYAEIELVEVFECGRERVMMVAPYKFQGVSSCEATALFCLDFRFRKETRSCIRDSLGIQSFDVIGVPGASKSFNEGSRVLRKALKVSYEQHSSRKFIIVHHQDCGAYGGSGNFLNSIEEEHHHRDQMRLFESRVKEKYLDASIIKVYARLIEGGKKIQFVLC
jgi:hypothetical protein